MKVRIHASAVVEPAAVLEAGVVVGPLCYVAAGVQVGEGTVLVSQVTLLGPARIGRRNRIYPHVTLGAPPQDRSFRGEPTELVVGDDNEIREQVTVHRGTSKGGGTTRIGSRCLLMVGVHVAHDCDVADDVTLTNYTSLGGHVEVGHHVVCGGHVAVAPFVRLGEMAFLAGGAMVERDVPPFLIEAGDRARVRGVNRVGLQRAGVPPASRRALIRAYRQIWRSGELQARGIEAARRELGEDPYVDRLLEFLASRR